MVSIMARDIYGVPMCTHDVREVIFWEARGNISSSGVGS